MQFFFNCHFNGVQTHCLCERMLTSISGLKITNNKNKYINKCTQYIPNIFTIKTTGGKRHINITARILNQTWIRLLVSHSVYKVIISFI